MLSVSLRLWHLIKGSALKGEQIYCASIWLPFSLKGKIMCLFWPVSLISNIWPSRRHGWCVLLFQAMMIGVPHMVVNIQEVSFAWFAWLLNYTSIVKLCITLITDQVAPWSDFIYLKINTQGSDFIGPPCSGRGNSNIPSKQFHTAERNSVTFFT